MLNNNSSPYFNSSRKSPWTISQLNLSIKAILQEMPALWIMGEISNLTKAKSGHYYFSLKDDKCQVTCAWFKGQQSSITLKEGLSVCVLAKPALYEPRGNYQLIISTVEIIGQGALYQAFLALKDKLATEGLFKQSRTLPKYPTKIGVITSPTGAALADICAVLKRRYPVDIIVYPAVVQGIAAPKSLINALTNAIQHNQADVLIIARGGGAYEDLVSFNDEQLARLVATSPIPTISGVGHEIDFTIVDFAADMRSATPSAAAEKCSPNKLDLYNQLITMQAKLVTLIQATLQQKQLILNNYKHKCQHPGHSLQTQQQTLDNLQHQLYQILQIILNNQQHKLNIIQQKLLTKPIISPKIYQTLELNKQQLNNLINLKLSQSAAKLATTATNLDALSPLKVLSRGFALVTNQQQKIISSINQISLQEELNITFNTGKITAKITNISDK